MQQMALSYVKKILEVACLIQPNDILIVYTKIDINELEEILLSLKKEYKIKKIIFLKHNYKDIYNFLKNKPDDNQIKSFITRYSPPKENKNVKILSIIDADYDGYLNKLNFELSDLYNRYRKFDNIINEDIYKLFDKCPITVFCYPTLSWAEDLLGSSDKIDELWNLINSTMLSKSELKKEIIRLKEIKDYLNKIKIKDLNFYTECGTDFRIGLSKNSIWSSEPSIKNGRMYLANFPSYEIFTAPDFNLATGQIVLVKPSELSGFKVDEATLKFGGGKCISISSNNEKWNNFILSKSNNLNRIGEIALVSSDNPLARLNETFNSLLLDENTGCHLALGSVYPECIRIPKFLLELFGYEKFHFNHSNYHQDLVFGDKSITVEARTKDKRKILILENGKWKI